MIVAAAFGSDTVGIDLLRAIAATHLALSVGSTATGLKVAHLSYIRARLLASHLNDAIGG